MQRNVFKAAQVRRLLSNRPPAAVLIAAAIFFLANSLTVAEPLHEIQTR